MEKSIYHDSRMSYLVIKPDKDIEDTLSMNMMKNNSINCLLDMECRYVDNKIALYYSIQGMQCMKEYIAEHNIGYKTARQLYQDIAQAVADGEEFFLSENSYVLNLEYIFWDKKNKRAGLCCIPEWQGDFQSDVKKLTEEIITYIDHSDKMAVKFIYGLYDLIMDDGFIVPDVQSYIKKSNSQDMPGNRTGYGRINANNGEPYDGKERGSGNYPREDAAEGNNVLPGRYGLRFKKNSFPFNTGKKRDIDIRFKDICGEAGTNNLKLSVGRSGDCNLVLPFIYISRYHAVIHIENGTLFIEDKCSVNGTCINGKKIPANVKTPCNVNDVVSFAGIECGIIIMQ